MLKLDHAEQTWAGQQPAGDSTAGRYGTQCAVQPAAVPSDASSEGFSKKAGDLNFLSNCNKKKMSFILYLQ